MQPSSHLGDERRVPPVSQEDLLTVPAASRWASEHMRKNVTPL